MMMRRAMMWFCLLALWGCAQPTPQSVGLAPLGRAADPTHSPAAQAVAARVAAAEHTDILK